MENTNRGLELIKKATQEDIDHNYTKAVELYENSVIYFNRAIQNGEVHQEKHRLHFQTKCDQYLERVKKLKKYLEKRKPMAKKITEQDHHQTNSSVAKPNNHDRRSHCIKLDCKICFSESPESLWILRCASQVKLLVFFKKLEVPEITSYNYWPF